MIVLGVDCSTKQSSVCVLKDNVCIYQCVQNTNITHSQNLLNMIQNALDICTIKPNDINLYAVTQGPGSFTGLRIGLAIIKGMACVNNTPCVGISSLQALAKSCFFDGIVMPAFDARRNQIYTSAWENDECLFEDCCINVNNLSEFVKTQQKNIFFVGDGSTLCYNIYGEFQNVKQNTFTMPCIAYGACLIALQEYEKDNTVTHFDLSPSYLRLSQAERELKEKMEGI